MSYLIRWIFYIGLGIGIVDMTGWMRDKAIKAHQKGPISHRLFTQQLTSDINK